METIEGRLTLAECYIKLLTAVIRDIAPGRIEAMVTKAKKGELEDYQKSERCPHCNAIKEVKDE